MNFETAIALAAEIRAHSMFVLVAIGRFVPVDQLADTERWGCSLRSFVDCGQGLTVVWSRDEWLALSTRVLKPDFGARPDQQHRDQPMS